MTREIKFRVWDKIMEDIAPLVELHSDWVAIPIMDEGGGHLEQRKIEDVELMQFTGLKDVNGVEIYEGDIVEWHDSIPNIDWYGRVKGVIEYRHGGFFVEALKASCEFSNYIWCLGEFKVIGNIYENKYLLK